MPGRFKLVLEFGDGGGAGLFGEPFFEGLVERSIIPQVAG
jgi:hypothetical protein